jgi:hypothetical protein
MGTNTRRKLEPKVIKEKRLGAESAADFRGN